MDTGLCHANGKPKRLMYQADDLSSFPPGTDILQTPVRVWDAEGGGETIEMTLREFNDKYMVDFRFDTSRVHGREVGQ